MSLGVAPLGELFRPYLPTSKSRARVIGHSAAQAADWPRPAGAWGSVGHALALREAPGVSAGRGLSHLASDI